MINTIRRENQQVLLLDQNLLPGEVHYQHCQTHEELAEAIRTLKVRGAPLIGVSAAFGMALAVQNYSGSDAELPAYYDEAEKLMAATRPTAVNLFWALRRMRSCFQAAANGSREELTSRLWQEAEAMHAEDIEINNRIGDYGQEVLGEDSRIMTICNAGALATCGYGTALGVIRSAYREGKLNRVWACETRPVLQGARLTIWELMQDKIPVTLITDNMAAAVMRQESIDAVVVGADRIAANGDTANKIGTYGLAVLAAHHKIPFYIAAPLSTVDIELADGSLIPIEERHADEVRMVRGQYITVADVEVFNPAFDVTPHELISGIITERGVIEPPFASTLRKLLEVKS